MLRWQKRPVIFNRDGVETIEEIRVLQTLEHTVTAGTGIHHLDWVDVPEVDESEQERAKRGD